MPGDLTEEGTLANPAGAADMHDASGRVVGIQALVKEGDLGTPAGETHPVPVLEPGGKRAAGDVYGQLLHPCSRGRERSAAIGLRRYPQGRKADQRHGQGTKTRLR